MKTKKNVVLAYRVKLDTGFAPCVTKDLLTLACCKGGYARKDGTEVRTGIRYWVGSKMKNYDWEKDNVYVMGTYHGQLLYCARITDAPEMKKYYANQTYVDRNDFIYSIDPSSGELKREKKRLPGVHKDKKSNDEDRLGTYVLCSEAGNYAYFGNRTIPISLPVKLPKGQETKTFYDEDANVLAAWFEELIEQGKGKELPPPNDKLPRGGCGGGC